MDMKIDINKPVVDIGTTGASGILIGLVLFAGLLLIVLWIIQTAVGYFGVSLSLWQSFVVILASFILFKK